MPSHPAVMEAVRARLREPGMEVAKTSGALKTA